MDERKEQPIAKTFHADPNPYKLGPEEYVMLQKHIPKSVSPAALVVVDQVVHRNIEQEPTSTICRFSRSLHTDEQPWIRHFEVTEEWKPIECGWIETCSMLVLENKEGRFTQVVPTQEERDEAALKQVILGYPLPKNMPKEALEYLEILYPTGINFLVVQPGESGRFQPTNVQALHIRSRYRAAKCVLTLYPG